MYDILRGKADGLKRDAIRFAGKLVRTPSLSLGEKDAADLVLQQMREVGFDKVLRDDYGNAVGIMFGRRAEPTLLLNSHMDTVDPGPDGSWDTPPFGGVVKNGRLHGVGAADCKGGLAAQIYAAALLKRSLLPLRGNLVVTATVAEENGASVGVQGLLENTLPELKLRPTFAIVGEPTNLGLYYGHDGWMEIDIRMESGNPFLLNDTARAVLLDCGRDSDLRADRQVQALETPEPVFEDLGGRRRGTIRMMRRLSEGESDASVLGHIHHEVDLLAQPAQAVAVEVAVREENQRLYNGRTTTVRRISHAWSIDPFHPLMERARQALSAAHCEVRPGKWALGRLGMGTAGACMLKQFQVPVIGYGPGHEEQAHARNEFVECENIAQAVYGTAAIVHSLVGIPVYGWTADEI
ncbi:MAG: M20/M25/M40 family metallo-hydrolase [Phycisphaerae bacterium]|nr:M20/M25/M40 family metallo-hydrolase [Phycisphaerae bacterium]